MSTVLVTGGSGFVAVHTILQLLAAGHQVRTTVRNPDRNKDVLAMLCEGGAPSVDRLSFFTADLEADAGWQQAIAGCDYVLHVASPLPSHVPRDENDLFGLVDVRDVADLHIRAMTSPAAKGERFIAVAGETMSMHDIARMLRSKMGAAAARVPRFQAPNWLVRLAAMRAPALRDAVPLLGRVRRSSNAKAIDRLGWAPRSNEEIIVATADSLLRFGLVKSSA